MEWPPVLHQSGSPGQDSSLIMASVSSSQKEFQHLSWVILQGRFENQILRMDRNFLKHCVIVARTIKYDDQDFQSIFFYFMNGKTEAPKVSSLSIETLQVPYPLSFWGSLSPSPVILGFLFLLQIEPRVSDPGLMHARQAFCYLPIPLTHLFMLNSYHISCELTVFHKTFMRKQSVYNAWLLNTQIATFYNDKISQILMQLTKSLILPLFSGLSLALLLTANRSHKHHVNLLVFRGTNTILRLLSFLPSVEAFLDTCWISKPPFLSL